MTFPYSSIAQMFFDDGFIVLKNQKKEFGKIKQIDNRTIKFFNSTTKTKIYTIDELLSYEVNDIPFIKENIVINNELEKTFLKEITIGYLSLYEIPKGINGMTYVIKKEGEKFQLLTLENAAVELRRRIYDSKNTNFLEKVRKDVLKYNQTHIENLIKSYNKFMKPNDKIRTPKSRIIFEFGLIGGFSLNQVNFTGFPDNVFVKANGLIGNYNYTPFGISVGVQPHKTFSVETEFVYNQYNNSRSFKFSSSTQIYNSTISFNEESVSIPVHAKLAIIQRPLNVSLKFGPQFVYEKSVNAYYSSNNIDKYPLFLSDIRNAVGFNCGIMMSKQIGNRFFTKLEYRYSSYYVSDGVTKMATRLSNQVLLNVSITNKEIKKYN